MSTPSNSLILSIAGIGVKIICPESGWLDSLNQRYQLFVGSQASALTLGIQKCRHARPESDVLDKVNFEGKLAGLRSFTYHGSIDPSQCHAELCVSDAHPVEDIDYFLRVTFALMVFQAGGILFHGAGIVHQNKGFLFFGHSGAGKTTVSRLSVGDQILNDDLVALIPPAPMSEEETRPPAGINPQRWSIHSTPFWNPTQVNPSQFSINLSAMFHLVQDKQVYLEPFKKSQALAELVACVPVIPLNKEVDLQLLERIGDLQKRVPVYNLHFLLEASFWRVIEQL